ncbi:translation initiation factor IF-2 [bacterium]|nr:translation initiation factor IF-2 [bacterium]
MKVNELAKSLKISDNQMVKFLSDLNIRIKGRSAKLDTQTVKMVRELYAEYLSEKEVVQNEARTLSLNFDTVSIREYAEMLDLKLSDIMQVLMQKQWVMNLNTMINRQQAIEIAAALNITVDSAEVKQTTAQNIGVESSTNDPKRPPVITVMGHVDHGKTSLLDNIRKTNVQAKEAGAITQHIGAYQVLVNGGKFTFLDTPGHAAFTSLRSRGVRITDLVILVIAADDGVKPQTIEAIEHAKAAGVPIIVALNKMDVSGANPDRVKQMLTEYELVCEEWGGETAVVPISAKTGDGIDALLDMIQLTADVLELTASTTGQAQGVVIEARLSKQKGPLATVLIQSGTLAVGQYFSVGSTYGKARALINDLGQTVQAAEPGMPVEIMGFSDVPESGSVLIAHDKEKDARKAVVHANGMGKHEVQVTGRADERQGNLVTVVVKADAQGSVDALKQLMSDEKSVKIRMVRAGLGDVTEDDINLAAISGGMIIGFGVKLSNSVQKIADNAAVEVRLYSVIYRAIEDLAQLIQGKRIVDYDYKQVGTLTVRAVYQYSKFGSIAGVYVDSGEVSRGYRATVTRGKKEIGNGEINSLKRFKEDVNEVKEGYECGVVVRGIDFQEGDTIAVYKQFERPVD